MSLAEPEQHAVVHHEAGGPETARSAVPAEACDSQNECDPERDSSGNEPADAGWHWGPGEELEQEAARAPQNLEVVAAAAEQVAL